MESNGLMETHAPDYFLEVCVCVHTSWLKGGAIMGVADLHKILWKDWSWAKGQLINCSCHVTLFVCECINTWVHARWRLLWICACSSPSVPGHHYRIRLRVAQLPPLCISLFHPWNAWWENSGVFLLDLSPSLCRRALMWCMVLHITKCSTSVEMGAKEMEMWGHMLRDTVS